MGGVGGGVERLQGTSVIAGDIPRHLIIFLPPFVTHFYRSFRLPYPFSPFILFFFPSLYFPLSLFPIPPPFSFLLSLLPS